MAWKCKFSKDGNLQKAYFWKYGFFVESGNQLVVDREPCGQMDLVSRVFRFRSTDLCPQLENILDSWGFITIQILLSHLLWIKGSDYECANFSGSKEASSTRKEVWRNAPWTSCVICSPIKTPKKEIVLPLGLPMRNEIIIGCWL